MKFVFYLTFSQEGDLCFVCDFPEVGLGPSTCSLHTFSQLDLNLLINFLLSNLISGLPISSDKVLFREGLLFKFLQSKRSFLMTSVVR